jgi:hypothetical protein
MYEDGVMKLKYSDMPRNTLGLMGNIHVPKHMDINSKLVTHILVYLFLEFKLTGNFHFFVQPFEDAEYGESLKIAIILDSPDFTSGDFKKTYMRHLMEHGYKLSGDFSITSYDYVNPSHDSVRSYLALLYAGCGRIKDGHLVNIDPLFLGRGLGVGYSFGDKNLENYG